MSNSFKQRRGLIKISAEIHEDGVYYQQKDIFKFFETKYPFEHIGDELVSYFNVSRLYMLIVLFATILFILTLASYLSGGDASFESVLWIGLWATIAAFGTWMRSVKYIGFFTSGGDLFFMDLKGKKSPRAFINNLETQKRIYFEKHYSARYQASEIAPDESQQDQQHDIH